MTAPAVHAEAQRRWRQKHPRPAAVWLGGSTAPEDVRLRERCRRVWPLGSPYYTPDEPMGLKLFALTFFPDYCQHPFNPMHEELFARHEARLAANVRGWKDVTAAPRESAKTTWYKIQIIHDALYEHERYIGIGSANFDQARDKVKDVRDVFTDNAELVRVYGAQLTPKWTESDFITQTGVRVRALTPRSKVRGFIWGRYRPTKILIDDVEDPELVLTQLRRDRLLLWLQSDVAKLGAQDLNLAVIGTILHPESMLAKLLMNPGFTSRTYQAVLKFAGEELDDDLAEHITGLWVEWRDLVLNLDDDDHLAYAHDFFLAHEAEMLQGAEVFWPEAQSYEYLMLDQLIYGDTAFFQERQNEPMHDSRYLFDMDAAAYCVVTPSGLTRANGTLVPWLDVVQYGAFYDPALGKSKDCAACVVVAKDRAGYEYVLDAYVTNTDSPDDQCQAIADLLWDWQVDLLGVETNGFQSLLLKNLREAFARKAQEEGQWWDVRLVPITHVKNKILRIKTLESPIKNHWLQFARTVPPEFIRQFRQFLPVPDAGRDDGPDSTEGALAVLRGKYRKQDEGAI